MRSVQVRSLALLLALLTSLPPPQWPGWIPEPGLSAQPPSVRRVLPPFLLKSERIVGEFKGYISGNFTGFRDVDYSLSLIHI